jgi:C-terminal processing protease CtpA/Prc
MTPKGVSISHNSIVPQIEVPMTKEDLEAKRDPQFDRAVKFLKTNK